MRATPSSSTDITPLPLPAWATTRGRIYFYDQYANNEQATAFSHYDPDRIAGELIATGADIVTIYAANQFSIAYYPSAIWPQHPGLKGRDYVGDLVTRLHAAGKKVITYINWLESKHPAWNSLTFGDGEPSYPFPLASWADPSQPNGSVYNIPGGHWQIPCINSPKREQVLSIARELLERYRPDGFHLDMFGNYKVCVCEYCRPALEEICGTAELTREVIKAHWREYMDWMCTRSAALVSELTELAHQYGAIGAHNGFAPLHLWAQFGQTEAWLPAMDVYTSECFDAFGSPNTDLNSTGINVRWQRAIGKPSWILRTSTPSRYAHWPITPAQWQVYAAACKANGCKVFGPCGEGARPDTTSAQELLENVKDGFDFFMQDADLDDGAEPAANIGLLFSWATRKYALPGDHEYQWTQELTGWGRLLIEEHLPFEMVAAERLERVEDLAVYEVLILPAAVHLSERCCDVLRGFVRQGGRLIATAGTSLGDGTGGMRDDFRLADVLGVSYQTFEDGHFALGGHREAEPASGGYYRVTAQADKLAQIVAIDPAGSVAAMKDPLALEFTAWPAFTHHTFSSGEAYYAAFAIGSYFNQHGDRHIAQRMRNLLDRAQPAHQLQVSAPRTVEVTLWQQPDISRTIIHLCNRTVPWTLPTDAREFTEIVPVHGVEVTIRTPYPDPVVTCRGTGVDTNLDGDQLTIRVDVLNAYAALVIEPSH